MFTILFQASKAIDHSSLWMQLPEIIGIPLVALAIIVPIKAATAEHDFDNSQMVELGMDMAILATGACGSVFANDVLYNKWGVGVVIYGIITVMLCIASVSWLARIRRWDNKSPVSDQKARRNLFLGAAPIGVVTAILVLGYTLHS